MAMEDARDDDQIAMDELSDERQADSPGRTVTGWRVVLMRVDMFLPR